ncbi:MAG: gluconolaconase, partial [Acidobacteriota bacterium]
APLVRPVALAIGPVGGEIYVADDRGRIVAIAPDGTSRTVAGSTPGFRDGAGEDARFRRPSGLALDHPGRLIVADRGNALVRLVAARSRLGFGPPPSPLIAPAFDADAFRWQPLLWPVEPIDGPHEIAGTVGEARGAAAERLHSGIDVRVEEGTRVIAVRDGAVLSPIAATDFGALEESLRIGPLAYVHIRVGRLRRNDPFDDERFVPTFDLAGTLVRMRVKRAARFRAGETIGTVNAFNHVHLSVGWPGEEHNPLNFRLPQQDDTIPPTIVRGGIRLFDEQGTPFTRRERGRLTVSGRVQVVVDAWDQMNGNRPNRRLGLYSLGFQVLTADRTPAAGFDTPRQTMSFDRLSADPETARLIYAPGSGIPFYGRRTTRFLYIVTNTFRGGVAATGVWDTASLPVGDYTLRILAADRAGNEARANRDLAVRVADVATSRP